MTKTIEELKTAKRELESKISQMVNEFANEHRCGLNVDVSEQGRWGTGDLESLPRRYVVQIDLKL